MRVLLDTNVVLDVLLARTPWDHQADIIWRATAAQMIECSVCASALTDIFYISRKVLGRERALDVVRQCLLVLTIVSVDFDVLWQAANHGSADFEDAVQMAAAIKANVDSIVTRDSKGFSNSPIAIVSPDDLVKLLENPTSQP
jgi:predicted nucleic acid-binding protein